MISGEVYCWGYNYAGQLGDGTRAEPGTPGTSPTRVLGNQRFKAVSLGDQHTCALASDGAAYCWGENRVGALGDGTTEIRTVPTRVRGNLTFVQISAGSSHTCGRTDYGVIYCWGWNVFGALGDGTTRRRLEPTRVLAR